MLLLTFAAAALDWRSRKIPNWLTVSGILAGIILEQLLAVGPARRVHWEVRASPWVCCCRLSCCAHWALETGN